MGTAEWSLREGGVPVVGGSSSLGGDCYIIFPLIMLAIPHRKVRGIRSQMTPIKAILRHGHDMINGLKTQPKMWLGWVCGLCQKTRLSMGFGSNQLNSINGPFLQNEGLIWSVRFVLNRPVRPIHRSDRRFRRFMSGPIAKWFNRVNRTGNVTGRRLNRLNRPVRSGF